MSADDSKYASSIKTLIKRRLPGLVELQRSIRREVRRRLVSSKPRDEVFREIFRSGHWGSSESASGRGSELVQTETLRVELPALLKRIGAKSMLDAACGDFHWMSEVSLGIEQYVGADIVPGLIEANQRKYSGPGREFRVSDMVATKPSRYDVILCRDCLVHLSFADIRAALKNFRDSGSEYILATTMTSIRRNGDIATGDWRGLNLQLAPFHFPEPIAVLNERCTEAGGEFADKSLGLWRLSSISLV
jgi:Methyltransferase domain